MVLPSTHNQTQTSMGILPDGEFNYHSMHSVIGLKLWYQQRVVNKAAECYTRIDSWIHHLVRVATICFTL